LSAAAAVLLVLVLLAGCSSKTTAAKSGPPTTAGAVSNDIPVDINVEGATGLKDAQEVRIRVKAHPGSAVYGFEAFLCNGGTSYSRDADIRPSLTGKCAADALSSGSDAYKEVRGAPPYEAVDATFRPGVGSASFAKRDETQATVTCGRAHPCQLVLKVQFPDGFAFRSYPLTYA